MGSNVFGNPITNKTLEQMPDYIGKKITRKDRAEVAMNMKNAENKDVKARAFVEKLKENWGTGISTLCLIYNATGDNLKLVGSNDWSGHIGPSPFPSEIANGQWGAFLYVKTSGTATGSIGACVYRGLNSGGDTRDWMLAWSVPWIGNTHAYAEIRERGHFNSSVWDYIGYKLSYKGQSYTDTWGGCVATVSIGSTTSPIYEGVMTLEGV